MVLTGKNVLQIVQSRKENKSKKRLEKSKKIKEILSIAKKNVCVAMTFELLLSSK